LAIDDLENRLFEMAESDPKNSVRLGAIELLSVIDADKYSPAFLRWINDPSYYVAGAALSAYLENEGNLNRGEIAGRFESEKNIRMSVALADYYIKEGIESKGNWFNDRLEALNGQSLYYFLGYYGDYFVTMPSEGSSGAIEKLYTIAKGHRANYIRIAAFMGLFGFIDEEGVLEKARDISKNEKDDMARQYQEFFLSNYPEEN
jgi:aminopeptidase N